MDDAKARAAALKAGYESLGNKSDALTATLSDLAERIGAGLSSKRPRSAVELDKYIMRTERTRVLLDGRSRR